MFKVKSRLYLGRWQHVPKPRAEAGRERGYRMPGPDPGGLSVLRLKWEEQIQARGSGLKMCKWSVPVVGTCCEVGQPLRGSRWG